MSSPSASPATILSRFSNQFIVSHLGSQYHCVVKGIEQKAGQKVLVGDRVEIDNIDPVNGSARICRVLPRQNALDRPQVANVTTLMVMTAVVDPPYSTAQLDRYITLGLLNGLRVVLCVSKMDLCPSELLPELDALEARYAGIGVSMYRICIHDPNAFTPLLSAMQDDVVVLAGPSGVGKSSFLNALRPDLGLKVGEVSEKLGRGTHTTRNETLIEIPHPESKKPLWWVDTPGFSHLQLDRVTPATLLRAFPEFAEITCQYPDCLHEPLAETDAPSPTCGLSLNPEAIHRERYAHYLSFLAEAKAFERRQRQSTQKERYGRKQIEGREALRLKQSHRAPSRRVLKQQDWEPDSSGATDADES